jgi:hypothetical protein
MRKLASPVGRYRREYRESPGWGLPVFQVECLQRQLCAGSPHPMLRPFLTGGLLLALASIASSESAPSPDEALSPMELLASVSLKPAQAPGAGAKSDAAQKVKADAGAAKAADTKIDPLVQCLRDWDAATHMTRQEWARTCRRVVSNRAKFLQEQGYNK